MGKNVFKNIFNAKRKLEVNFNALKSENRRITSASWDLKYIICSMALLVSMSFEFAGIRRKKVRNPYCREYKLFLNKSIMVLKLFQSLKSFLGDQKSYKSYDLKSHQIVSNKMKINILCFQVKFQDFLDLIFPY